MEVVIRNNNKLIHYYLLIMIFLNDYLFITGIIVVLIYDNIKQ